MLYRFCPQCGTPLQPQFLDGRQRMACRECGFIHYNNPTPAAGALVARDHTILLVKRKFEPGKGDWGLPGGFIESDETAAQAGVRETKEETGLDVRIRRIFDVVGTRVVAVKPVVLVIYQVDIIGGQLQAGDDAIDARFFPFDALPENIAFPTHRKVLEAFIVQFGT